MTTTLNPKNKLTIDAMLSALQAAKERLGGDTQIVAVLDGSDFPMPILGIGKSAAVIHDGCDAVIDNADGPKVVTLTIQDDAPDRWLVIEEGE